MRAEIVDDVVERYLEMFQHGLCNGHIVVVGHHLVQNAPVAGLLDVCGNGENEPQRVVGEVAADVSVALFGEGLVLVIAAAVRELGGSDVDDTLSCPVGDLVNEAEHVLVGVAEAHAASDAALEVGSGAGEVERNHALVLVPDVDHAVYLVVRRVNVEDTEELVPCLSQLCKACSDLLGSVVLLDHCVALYLVDGLSVSLKLFSDRHFNVAEDKYEGLALASGKGDLLVVGSDGGPAVGEGVVSLAVQDCLRIVEAVVQSDKGIAVGVVAVDGIIYGVECEVVAAVAVFGLVVDGGANYLNTAGREVALEVGAVVLRVPETPLSERPQLECLRGIALVGENKLLYLAVVVLRNEERSLGFQPVLLAGDDGIAHTVAALVAVKLGLHGGPARVPDSVAVFDVEVSAAHVYRHVVVAVTGDTAQARVLIEAVSACRVGYQREESLGTEVVYPRVGSAGRSNYILAVPSFLACSGQEPRVCPSQLVIPALL